MTREEAIQLLTQYIDYNPDVPDFYTMEEAIKVIIEALEQEPCEDAISRQAVLDKLNRLIEVERLQGTDEMGYGRERVSAYESMIFEINSEYLYPSVTPKPKWIACSERLPENGEVVLGTNSSNDLFKAYTWDDCGEIKWCADGCLDVPVIAWMPLPEPYKECEEK